METGDAAKDGDKWTFKAMDNENAQEESCVEWQKKTPGDTATKENKKERKGGRKIRREGRRKLLKLCLWKKGDSSYLFMFENWFIIST